MGFYMSGTNTKKKVDKITTYTRKLSQKEFRRIYAGTENRVCMASKNIKNGDLIILGEIGDDFKYFGAARHRPKLGYILGMVVHIEPVEGFVKKKMITFARIKERESENR